MLKITDSAIHTRLTKKNPYHILPPEFCKEAVKVCPSNLLIAKLLNVSNGTISLFRAKRIDVDSSVPAGRRYGLCSAYRLYIEELLKVAIKTNTIVNHVGYQTYTELSEIKSKTTTTTETVAVSSVAKRMLNRYSKEEKIKINNAVSPKEAYDAIGGDSSGRKFSAVKQMWEKQKRKSKNIKVKTSPKTLDIVDVSPSFTKHNSVLKETIFAAKSAGAKSVTTAEGVKIEF
jgi:hypothetical protein